MGSPLPSNWSLELLGSGDPIERAEQADVHQHQIRSLRRYQRQRLLARTDHPDDGVAKGLDRGGEVAGDNGLIFDNEEVHRH